MQEILFNLIYCVCYALILAAVKAVVTVLIPYIQTKLSKSQYEWATLIVKNAVRAYEQTIKGSGKGELKFDLVSEAVVQELKKKGISIGSDQLLLLIESAVHEMNADKLLLEAAEPVDDTYTTATEDK